ncbi:hypothetical protein BJ875DRAFT_526067, partial [Amylocarpus encephaloides]
KILGLYPCHLATTYLDGSKTCCNILDASVNNLECWLSLYTNNYGHTVLDNLFITILKGHTSCTPVTVDDAFQKLRRFPGEEVDICGRWDADSECVRELFANGNASIPFEWKHMFCHTSIQAVVHCIGRIFGPVDALDVNTPSGLFMKRCQCCEVPLKFFPLHSLVLIAFHLARSGCEGENLFGILACLVCLLANGANPLFKATDSLKALMGTERADECSHEDIDPLELAERVPKTLMTFWTEEAKLGWQVFCATLSLARDERNDEPFEHSDDEMEIDLSSDAQDVDDETELEEDEPCENYKPAHDNFYCQSRTIGTLWAAIQTELLSYRRLNEGDEWLSKNFNMLSLLDGLRNGGAISIPLVENDMISPYCQCGRFLNVDDEACACVAEACAYYFCNMEDWERSAYITLPEDGCEWYE